MILFGIFNLKIFYIIFGPLTVRGTYLILSLSSNVVLAGRKIIFGTNVFEIVNSCVIGSAYYLLFVLFMSFQDIKLLKRVLIILLSFCILYISNILRIVILISIIEKSFFGFAHWVFWNFISTVFVVGIFFFLIWFFHLREIPFQRDILYLWKLAHKTKSKG